MRREKIIWNVDNINRLWAYYASLDMDGTNYFGYQAGMAIVHLCSFFVDNLQECEVLDYGRGIGHIIERFLDKKVNISGVDMSKESSIFTCRITSAANPGGYTVLLRSKKLYLTRVRG